MTFAPPLIGTRRAYDRCGGCRHARIRHADRGINGCTDMVNTYRPGDSPGLELAQERCTCPAFVEQEK